MATVAESGPIDEIKKAEEIRAEPYALPTGFVWVTMDVNDDAQVRPCFAPICCIGSEFACIKC